VGGFVRTGIDPVRRVLHLASVRNEQPHHIPLPFPYRLLHRRLPQLVALLDRDTVPQQLRHHVRMALAGCLEQRGVSLELISLVHVRPLRQRLPQRRHVTADRRQPQVVPRLAAPRFDLTLRVELAPLIKNTQLRRRRRRRRHQRASWLRLLPAGCRQRAAITTTMPLRGGCGPRRRRSEGSTPQLVPQRALLEPLHVRALEHGRRTPVLQRAAQHLFPHVVPVIIGCDRRARHRLGPAVPTGTLPTAGMRHSPQLATCTISE
jgi:hypothetical protein